MTQDNDDPVIRLEPANGVAFIPKPTALTRLHYFDGKFLRADDLRAEQSYTRALVQRSNLAGGWGVVHGFHMHLGTGASLTLHPGLAIDPKGRLLSLPGPQTVSVDIETLVAASRSESAPSPTGPSGGPGFGGCAIPSGEGYIEPVAPSDLYLIVLCHIEAACGIDEQFGALCTDACATETDYRYLVEGVEVRALPLGDLVVPKPAGWPISNANLRSRVASAFFAAEPEQSSLISGGGLRGSAWCFGAEPGAETCVPVGILAYGGGVVRFFDPWISRRERMEGVPRRYWSWRMAMRPWSVFLAQVLQFQCHLVEATGLAPAPGVEPCADEHALLDEAAEALDALRTQYQRLLAQLGDGAANAGLLENLEALMGRLQTAQAARTDTPDDHVLLKRGMLELPPAGYLPVSAQTDLSVNAQVRALMGDGVELRFCVVRPDYVPHALEEAQHLDRISLTQGLVDAESKPKVDILVPDGVILETAASVGTAWRARGTYQESPAPEPPYRPQGGNAENAWENGMVVNPGNRPAVELAGMGRSVIRDGMAMAHFAGGGTFSSPIGKYNPKTGEGRRLVPVEVATFLDLSIDRSPFDLAVGRSTSARLRGIAALREDEGTGVQIALQGSLTITERPTAERVFGRLSLQGGRSELRGGGQAVFGRFDVALAFRLLGDGGSFSMEADSAQEGRIFCRSSWRNTPREVQVLFAWLDQALAPSKKMRKPLEELRRPNIDPEPAQPDGIAHMQPAVDNSDRIAERIAERAQVEPTHKQPPFVVNVELTRDGRVERADDPDRQRAERAIEVIAQELREPSFQAEAHGLLFPPETGECSLIVQATQDWVFFHRRRERVCAVPPPVEPCHPVTPVRYEVLVVQDADSGLSFEKTILSVLVGRQVDDNPLSEVRRIGTVEFLPGQSALYSDADALRARWSAADPGLEASLAVIGGADVLPVIGRGRLDQVIGALSTVDDTLPQPTDFSETVVDVLEGSTARYPTVGHDGFILFVVTAMPQVVEECHEVWVIESEEISAGRLVGISAFQMLEHYNGRRLGEVRFRPADAIPLDDVNALPGVPDGVDSVGVVYRGDGPSNAPEMMALARGRAYRIAQQIEPNFDGGEELGGITYRAEEAQAGCQGLTILFVNPAVEPARYRVAMHFNTADTIDGVRRALENEPAGVPEVTFSVEDNPLDFTDFTPTDGVRDSIKVFLNTLAPGGLRWASLTAFSAQAQADRKQMADTLQAVFNELSLPVPRADDVVVLPLDSALRTGGADYVLLVGYVILL